MSKIEKDEAMESQLYSFINNVGDFFAKLDGNF